MEKKKYPLPKVYRLLGSGPVVLITSKLKDQANIMPIAWTTPLEFDPPLVACCIGDQSFTFEIVQQTKEFGINIPSADLAQKVYNCGHVHGQKVDKFEKFSLTAVAASKIKAPLIEECFANLECEVIDTSMVENHCLFIAKVVSAQALDGEHDTLHHLGANRFKIASKVVEVKA